MAGVMAAMALAVVGVVTGQRQSAMHRQLHGIVMQRKSEVSKYVAEQEDESVLFDQKHHRNLQRKHQKGFRLDRGIFELAGRGNKNNGEVV